MLSQIEENFIRLFLKDFSTSDLLAVATNITKHNLTPADREDALKIICQHSDCVEAVLEKRKVTKSYLSQFLHENRVSITNSWDKSALIRKILEHWNVKKTSVSADFIEGTFPSTSHQFQNPCNTVQNPVEKEDVTHEYYCQLAHQFSEWFYSLFNDEDVSKLGPEHFFADSQMKFALQDKNCTDVTEAKSSNDIAGVLRDIKLKYNFKFLPNLAPNAVQYKADIHGQVVVMVGGTLHSNSSQVVGLFEQMFLLIRDPSDNNNWKIKNSQVMLRSANPAVESSMPTEPVVRVCT